MADNPNQPKAYDVVLGGQVPIPSSIAVLGGLEGIKRHLTSAVALQRISALSDALKYGQKGLALVIQALKDESWEVQQSAYHAGGSSSGKRRRLVARSGWICSYSRH